MPHLEFISSVIPYVTISKYLLHLFEMQTVIKQAIRVNVLQMCCKCAAKLVQTREKKTCFLFRVQPSLTLVKYGNKQR